MDWGFLSLAHIISLLIAGIIIVIIHYSLCKLSNEIKTIVLFILSIFPIVAIIYNLISYHSPLENLPLNVCDIGALILPFVILFPRKKPSNFLLLTVLASACGLLFNNAPEAGYFSLVSIMSYFPLVLLFGIPILIFTLDLSTLDIKCLPYTLMAAIVIYTVVHFINIGINSYCLAHEVLNWSGEIIEVNYMGSIKPDNIILQSFYNIIPFKYWYMAIGLGIDFIYLVLIYGVHNYSVRLKKTKEIE